jgi:hypothetical protein
LGAANEAQSSQIVIVVGSHAAIGPFREPHEPNPLIVSDSLHIYAARSRKFANSKFFAFHNSNIYSFHVDAKQLFFCEGGSEKGSRLRRAMTSFILEKFTSSNLEIRSHLGFHLLAAEGDVSLGINE